MPYLGALIALITLVASTGTFIFTSIQTYIESTRRFDRVVIVDLNTWHAVVILNNGTKETFVRSLEIECPHWPQSTNYLEQYDINASIKPGEILTMELNKQARDADRQSQGDVVGELNSNEWASMLTYAESHLVKYGKPQIKDGDVAVWFLSSDSATLSALKRKTKLFNSVDAVARLYFWSAESAKQFRSADQTAVGVFVVNRAGAGAVVGPNSSNTLNQLQAQPEQRPTPPHR